MFGHVAEPRHAGFLVAAVGAAGADVDLSGKGVVDRDLPLFFQQRDNFPLGEDEFLDPSFDAFEEADDGALFRKRRQGHRQALELVRVDMGNRNPPTHQRLLARRRQAAGRISEIACVDPPMRTKADHVAPAAGFGTDQIDRGFAYFLGRLAGRREQHVAEPDRGVFPGFGLGNERFAFHHEAPMGGVQITVADAWDPGRILVQLAAAPAGRERPEPAQRCNFPMPRYRAQAFHAGILHLRIGLETGIHRFTSLMMFSSSPPVSLSRSRISARISSNLRTGCGL